MKKLWGKSKLEPFVEAFVTKDNILLDQKLTAYDILASIAHAKGLHKIGVLTKSELTKLAKGLKEILEADKKGKFKLEPGSEDIHTKIENYLTEKYGDVGKKIHTGRSRNDQVLTAIRLYTKNELSEIKKHSLALIKTFSHFQKKYKNWQMPGYTHMQKAMPSSLGIWAGSFKESLEDDLAVLESAYKLVDQSPLGSAAGYGVPLPLDREYTAKLLNFEKVTKNPLYCQNSRGKIEAQVLAGLVQVLLTINKFANDVMLFSTGEFGFFKVSPKVVTGSSIMPQKKNVDVAEQVRSKVHLVLGHYTSMVSLSSNLPSGYNADLQDTKRPLFESLELAHDSLKIANLLLKALTPNRKALEDSLTPELFATHKALEKVAKGVPFRDAHKEVGKNYEEKD